MTAPAAAPVRRWEVGLRAGRVFGPIIASDGTLYLGTSLGVAAVGPSGEVKWNARVGAIAGPPALTPDGDLAAATQTGDVLRIGTDGRLERRLHVAPGFREPPLVLADGSVVVSAWDQALRRVDEDGRELFRIPLPDRQVGSPAWTGRGVIAVPSGSELSFVSSEGELRGRASFGAPVVAGPATGADGIAWVLTSDGALYAVDETGRVRSRTSLGTSVGSANGIAIGPDGAVRVTALDAGLLCVGPGGQKRWQLRNAGAFAGGVSVDAQGTTLALNAEGWLYAVGADGQVRWRVETGSRAIEPPVLGQDGTVYVATLRGTLQAWH